MIKNFIKIIKTLRLIKTFFILEVKLMNKKPIRMNDETQTKKVKKKRHKFLSEIKKLLLY